MSKTDNAIQFFVDAKGSLWKYYDGSFWSTAPWKDKMCLLACPASADGTPDIEAGEVNSCDVEECEQHHLDFVNESFKTEFKLKRISNSGIGNPTLG